MIAQGIGLHHLHRLQLLEAGLLCNLVLSLVGIVLQMSHVGDVAHVTHLVAQMPQQFEEHIVGNSRAGMAQMGVAVDGRSAHIHPHPALVNGPENLLLAGERICKSKFAH